MSGAPDQEPATNQPQGPAEEALSPPKAIRNTKGQFVPGQSGNVDKRFHRGNNANPTGKKGLGIRAALRRQLVAAANKKKGGNKRRLDEVCAALVEAAATGDVRAAEVIFDRLLGRPKQEVGIGLSKGATFKPMTVSPGGVINAAVVNATVIETAALPSITEERTAHQQQGETP